MKALAYRKIHGGLTWEQFEDEPVEEVEWALAINDVLEAVKAKKGRSDG